MFDTYYMLAVDGDAAGTNPAVDGKSISKETLTNWLSGMKVQYHDIAEGDAARPTADHMPTLPKLNEYNMKQFIQSKLEAKVAEPEAAALFEVD